MQWKGTCPFSYFWSIFFTNLSDLGAHDYFVVKNKIIREKKKKKHTFGPKYRLSMGGQA